MSTLPHAPARRACRASARGLGVAAALLAGSALAQARVEIGVGLAWPVVPAYGGVGGWAPAAAVVVGGGWHAGHRHRGHRGWHRGWGWGVGTGLWLAPTIVWPIDADRRPAPVVATPPLPLPPSRPDPVVYPRHGQDARQQEADQQACDRWATTLPAAMADAGVFHRAVAACLEGRDYVVR